MKVKLYKNIVKFSKDGADVEVVIRSSNRTSVEEVNTLVAKASRDSGISTEADREEIEIKNPQETP